jgi:hypothetical protein
MSRPLCRAVVTLLLAFAPGCADLTIGVPYAPAKVHELEPLRTKRAEVDALLGPPLRTEHVGAARLVVHAWVTPDVSRAVVVTYSDDDLVVHVSSSE